MTIACTCEATDCSWCYAGQIPWSQLEQQLRIQFGDPLELLELPLCEPVEIVTTPRGAATPRGGSAPGFLNAAKKSRRNRGHRQWSLTGPPQTAGHRRHRRQKLRRHRHLCRPCR